MLKAGNRRALILFRFWDPGQIHVEDLSFDKQMLAIGDDLQFYFELKLGDKEVRRVRLVYGVDYVKANSKTSRKIFQIGETDFQAGSYRIKKKHSFKNLTTLKHYQGPHQFTIIVNGIEKAKGIIQLFPLLYNDEPEYKSIT